MQDYRYVILDLSSDFYIDQEDHLKTIDKEIGLSRVVALETVLDTEQ